MDINDTIPKPKNTVSWVLYDEKTGEIKSTGCVENQVQTKHATALATQCDSTPSYASGLYCYMDLGTGAIPAAAGTDLTGASLGPGARQAVTSSTSSGAVTTVVATFAAGTATGGPFLSAGMYNSNLTGQMMCCATINVTKGVGDALALTWAITFS